MSGLVLVTRPRAQAEKTAAILKEKGYESFIEPMLAIAPLAAPLPDLKKFDALVFTSTNGIEAFAARTAGRVLPAYVVGEVTGEAARAAGFADVRTGGGTAASLKENLRGHRAILYVSGEQVTDDLFVPGTEIERLVLYRADAAQALTPACRKHLEQGDFSASLFYSRRTAETFAALVKKANLAPSVSLIRALCISAGVVECLKNLSWKDIRAARTPDQAGMMALLEAEA